MDTLNKFGLKKSKAILLFMQMILIIFQMLVSFYLLCFVIKNNLGGWMISSYILISISIIAVIVYSIYGYKKEEIIFTVSVIPFLVAVFINILLPNRDVFQIALLSILFALIFAFILRQNDYLIGKILLYSMIGVSLTFSIYSAITANISFLGEMNALWTTYLAMYLSIFIPTIMSGTFTLIYIVRNERK